MRLVLLAQVRTHYKIGKLNMWTLFCNVCISFLNSQIWKEIMIELTGKPSSVITSSTDFSFQNLVFWNLFEFSAKKPLKNQYLPQSESKCYQINPLNPTHQDLSNNTKGTFQFLWNFQLQFNLIFSEEIIQYSRTSTPQVQTPWNQADAPLLLESFPKRPRTPKGSQFSGSHKYKTNKLPSFIHRCEDNEKNWVLVCHVPWWFSWGSKSILH
jgi:hypothetical protein